MKTLVRLLLLLLPAVLLLTSGAAAATRETRSLAAFSEISLGGSPTVILRQGSPQKVEVEGDPTDLARLETVVEGSRLRIRRKPENFRGNDFQGKVTVYITIPDVNALSVGGSGTIKAVTDIQSHHLKLSVSGSGDISLPDMQADALDSSVAGSGTISIAGICPQHNLSVSGSGDVKAAKLRSEVCSVRISGSGSAYLQATKTLDARIAGSGDVYVTGNPRVSSSTAGSGRVHSS